MEFIKELIKTVRREIVFSEVYLDADVFYKGNDIQEFIPFPINLELKYFNDGTIEIVGPDRIRITIKFNTSNYSNFYIPSIDWKTTELNRGTSFFSNTPLKLFIGIQKMGDPFVWMLLGLNTIEIYRSILNVVE